MTDILTQKILDRLADGRERTTGEIAERVNCDQHAASVRLRSLARQGAVVSEEVKVGASYVVWRATP